MIESMKRVIDAWDASVLPKNHDGRLWQVLEEMRQDIAEAEKAEPVAWLITDENINHLQIESIQKLIDRARHANMTDIKLRINGQDEWYQADWLKHMTRTSPPQRQPLSDEQMLALLSRIDEHAVRLPRGLRDFARAIEAAHVIKEKNT